MVKIDKNKKNWQRVLYTLCFFALCLIDWAKVSLSGRIQMTATNMTGIVMAFIIFSASNLKRFIKPVFALWLVMCTIAIPIGIQITLTVYPYKGQVISAALNILLYGFILTRTLIDLIKFKKFIGLRVPIFIIWLGMLALMLFSVNENIWPIWYAIVFGSFYLTEFDKDTEKCILLSIPDGFILGFFAIQGMALLFRPYDVVRYVGFYVNPNFNALFYLMSYSAFLCKWYLLKKEGKHLILRTILSLLAASMYGFCIYTGSKSAMLAMLVITVPFSLLFLKYCKNKVVSFAWNWMLLGAVGMISIPIVYVAIRYMPTIHLHPLYFEGEYSIDKVQPGEPRESGRYISFKYAMENNVERYFYIIPKFGEYIDTFLTLKVQAAELEEYKAQEYLFSEDEVLTVGIDPAEMRRRICKYYFDRLNMVGHTNDYEGAPISPLYDYAPHAHNVFIQMAFLYGVPSGILFILIVMAYVPACISLMRTGEDYRVCLISCYILAFVVFGFFEIDWMCGQLPFAMFFLLFRDVTRKSENQLNKCMV